MLQNILSIALLALGFGFVIFWHELGHFLAAKWVGIRVEQFAVGFGHAVLAWRKGIGFRVGTTTPEYERRLREHVEKSQEDHLMSRDRAAPTPEQLTRAADELKLGETEYRLNWLPLGGYVKMLGQDDLNPNATVEDPRAYNRKSIGARMFVVSAGVVMNVILAAILFMGLFMYGFRAPPAVVGGVQPWSPAQNTWRMVNGQPQDAPLRVGDEILTYNGQPMHDWTKIQLAAALSEEGENVELEVKRVDGTVEKVYIKPLKADPNAGMGLALGVEMPHTLFGPPKGTELAISKDAGLVPPDVFAVRPGEAVIAINGEAVDPKDPEAARKLEAAVQRAGLAGEPLKLTVRGVDGNPRAEEVRPRFAEPFGNVPLHVAGMTPRAAVGTIVPDGSAAGKLLPGDAILNLVTAGDPNENPTREVFVERIVAAGKRGQPVKVIVLRGTEVKEFDLTLAKLKEEGLRGTPKLGVAPVYDVGHAVVAAVAEGSPAAAAGIPAGATVTAVAGKPVKNWHDLHRLVAAAEAGKPMAVTATTPNGEITKELTLTADQLEQVRGLSYAVPLAFENRTAIREAKNPLQAAAWGVTETRDFILQFYLTIRRMVDGSVSPKNLMGPLGIFRAGHAFAIKGGDWLVWFLAMISANLAVVNFLPIPIVDGGLFLFLVFEKIKGKPLSPRTQAIAQVVGLTLLLGIFLFVTYHDIMRQF